MPVQKYLWLLMFFFSCQQTNKEQENTQLKSCLAEIERRLSFETSAEERLAICTCLSEPIATNQLSNQAQEVTCTNHILWGQQGNWTQRAKTKWLSECEKKYARKASFCPCLLEKVCLSFAPLQAIPADFILQGLNACQKTAH